MRKYSFQLTSLFNLIFLSSLITISFGQNTNLSISEPGFIKDTLEKFNGDKKYYKYKDFPDLKYSKPKINEWVNSLVEISSIPENEKHIVIGSKNNEIIFIRTVTEPSTYSKKVYTVMNDTIKLEVSGITVSAPNYSLFIYKHNFLITSIQYLACSSKDKDNLSIHFCPYREESYEYFRGMYKAKFVKTTFINKLSENEKNFIIEYNKEGKQINKTFFD